MLLNLHVKNLALIHESEVNFGPGLNILTGETGAGKSIIIGSMNLALGEKVSKSMIREDAEYAFVELIFSVDEPEQVKALEDMEVFPENGEIIMSRKILTSGRSVCRINSETVSASLMRKVASLLIDIHGQHEHQSLLTKKNHMKYLDAYAKKELEPLLSVLSDVYKTYTSCKKELDEAAMDQEQQNRELSFLQYEWNEIEDAQLKPGEDEQLESEYKRLSNGQKIMQAMGVCRDLCSDGMSSAADQVGRAVRELLSVSDYDEHVGDLANQLQELDNLLSDFNRDLSDYADDFEFSDEMFDEIESRLDVINHLKSKYGNTIEQILEEQKEKESKIETLLHYDEYRQELEAKLKESENEVRKLSQKISEIRSKYAEVLVTEVIAALQALNFLDVRFQMEFSQMDHYTANGWDEGRFLISTNPGESLKPLDLVASGGELSRIMLALKTVLAESDDIDTLIFDEIDSGISGRTAQMVAEKMKLTGMNHQVICITHLPQIAAMADQHFLIEKTANQEETVSEIRNLSQEESIQELARMLGGVKITDTVLQSAREMKEMANAVR